MAVNSSSDPYRGLNLSANERRDLTTSIAKERGIKYRSAQRYVQRLTTTTGAQRISGKGKAVKVFRTQLTKVKQAKRFPAITRGAELLTDKRVKIEVEVQKNKPIKKYELKPDSFIFFYYDPLPDGYKAIVWDSPESTQSAYSTREDALHVAQGFLGGFKFDEVMTGTGNRGMIHLVTVLYVPASEQDVYQKVTGKRQYNLVKEFRQGSYQLRALVGVPDRKAGQGAGGVTGGEGERGTPTDGNDDDPPLDDEQREELEQELSGLFEEEEPEENEE